MCSQSSAATLTAINEQTITAHHLRRRANPVLSDLRTGLPPQSRLSDEKRSEHLMRKSRFSKTVSETAAALSSLFSFRLLSLSFFFQQERRKRESGQKTPPQKILKRILSGGEVSRLHRDGEGLTSTHSGEPHHYLTPAFSLTPQAQRKSLAKRDAAKAFRRCDGEEGSAASTAPSPFEKGPGLPKLKRQKRRLNTDLFAINCSTQTFTTSAAKV